MAKRTKEAEQQVLGEIAAQSSEMAAANIRKYLESHRSPGAAAKVVHLVMKLADDARADLEAAVESSVKAALNNLERYRQSKSN